MEDQKKSTSVTKSQAKNSKSENKDRSPKKEQRVVQIGDLTKKKIILGICAVKKKVQSKPMRQILKRIKCEQIQILEMWDCLDKDYKLWPRADALICFYSDGFPYMKAWKYIKKQKPFLINNLEKQQYLWDRTAVYDILKKIHIPVAKHFMIFRDMNYIDDIEAKAFPDENCASRTPSEITMNQLQAIQFDFKTSQNNLFLYEAPDKNTGYIESQLSNILPEIKQSNRRSSNSSNYQQNKIQLLQQIDVLTKKNSTNSSLARNTTMGNLTALKTVHQEKIEFKQDKQRGALTAKRSIGRDLGNQSRPNTLRKFQEQRASKVENYEVQEVDDHILIKSKQTTHKLKKPFVQKPFDSQNHQICIYYPESMGGGRKMLFRKEKNSSSKFEQDENHIRRDGNYIYEQFLPTNAFDIKVYTIGCYYMYAEARKSPTLDGVVERDSQGKQKRFPIILTPEQKFIAKKIVQQFQQQVCGFDLLRANGKSYVCDVNGWSFVKSNSKYWDDCAIILKRKIFTKFFPELRKQENRIYQRFKIDFQNGYRPPIIYLSSKTQELRSIVSIFRHGDRSPKLKLKFKTKQEKFIAYFNEISSGKVDEIKVKDAKNLIKLLQVTNDVIADSSELKNSDLTIMCQMKAVLQSGGQFQGLNRKCQLKVVQKGEDNQPKKILIVVKWGGELSSKGSHDAFALGQRMRMQKYDDQQDLLSLHSSYRHDLKTYSSDEGRCIKTAASFLKGFLNIEGGLAPIITSLVRTDSKAQILLDCTSQQNHSSLSETIVQEISDMLNSDEPLLDSFKNFIEEDKISPQMLKIIRQIDRPRLKLKQMHEMIIDLTLILQTLQIEQIYTENERNSRYSHGSFQQQSKEDRLLIYKRWSKLQKDFFSEEESKFNISKIPEIYDTIRHDLTKNNYIFSNINFKIDYFLQLSRLFAHFVVPNEYGITENEKILTAQQIASPLLEKIKADLTFWKQRNYEELYWKYTNSSQKQSWKHIRTRLYFTSASHIYSVLHLMTLGNDRQLLNSISQENSEKIRQCLYMSYLSHIEFRLYENLMRQVQDPNRFRLELSISPDYSKDEPIKQISFGKEGFTIDKINNFFKNVIKPGINEFKSKKSTQAQKQKN